jgi:hypothetical protein
MSIYTASQATTTVAEITTAGQQAAQSLLVTEYQIVFDAIQRAALTGQTQVNLRWTKRQYLQAVGLFNSIGYTVTAPPTDGVNSNDNTVQYPLTISWPASLPGPAITSIMPTSITAIVSVPLLAEFIPEGGTQPFTFTVTGSIPNGLTFGNLVNSNTLLLSGIPTSPKLGVNSLTIQATDSAGQSFSQIISINIVTQSNTVVNNITNNTSQAAIGLIIGLS